MQAPLPFLHHNTNGITFGTILKPPISRIVIRELSIKLKLAYFPVIYSMSLATRPVSDALGNSKGVMSQDLFVSLPCHCNFRDCVRGDFFPPEGEFSEDRTRFEKRDM
jgi:hypothetical protein